MYPKSRFDKKTLLITIKPIVYFFQQNCQALYNNFDPEVVILQVS